MKSLRVTALLSLCLFGAALARADDMPAPAAGPGDSPAPSLGTQTPSAPAPAPAPQADTGTGQIPSAPSSPEAQPGVPLNSIPGKTSQSPKGFSNDDNGKDIYDQYDDYLAKEKVKQATEKKEDQRTMFPHENGSWQIGLSYTRNALSGYNFNYQNFVNPATGSATAVYGTSTGGDLGVTWFPLHSLTFGRLGFGIQGGIFWTQLSTPTQTQSLNSDGATYSSVSATTSATPQNIITYGVRAIYEFDYALGQLFVPFGEVGVDEVVVQSYSVVAYQPSSASNVVYINAPRRQLSSQYFGGGVRLNLNRLESSAASRALVSTGIRKFYLTYTAQERVGTFQGLTHNLGLDFEF